MANNQSIEKILNFLKEQKTPVTKTQIVGALALPSKSVLECLELLHKFKQIDIITNGKTSLIIIKQNCEVVK